jgi:hypothetical protein
MFDQGAQPADLAERIDAQRHGGAEAVLAAKLTGHQCARQKPMADRGRAKAGHDRPARGKAGIQRGHQPDLGQRQACDQSCEIGRGDMHITIGNDQHIMLGGRQHVDQIADLAVGAVFIRADYHCDID